MSTQKAVETALSSPVIYNRAMRNAGIINAAVNADPSKVYAPTLFNTKYEEVVWWMRYRIVWTTAIYDAFWSGTSSGSPLLRKMFLLGDERTISRAELIQIVNAMKDNLSIGHVNRLYDKMSENGQIAGLTRSQAIAVVKQADKRITQIKDSAYDWDFGGKKGEGKGVRWGAVGGFVSYSIALIVVSSLARIATLMLNRLIAEQLLGRRTAERRYKNALDRWLGATILDYLNYNVLEIAPGLIPEGQYGRLITLKQFANWAIKLTPGINLIDALAQTLIGLPAIDTLLHEK